MAAARAFPLESCVARCSAEQLRALADAARYSNQTDAAALALRALRRRFVGTSDATVAAFLLGRTYESRRQWRDAGDWYGIYLTEAPDGELAVEASSGRARVAGIRGSHRDDDGQRGHP